MKHLALIVLAALLGACVSLDSSRHFGTGLPLNATAGEVLRTMGEPSMQWQDADGTRLLAYPRGPRGVHTWMLRISADGHLRSIENALEPRVFAHIKRDQSMDEVLRLLGPPDPSGTAYFERRDELVWQWRFCEDFGELAHFYVLFDGTSGRVRSTLSLLERNVGSCGGIWGSCGCRR
jgi:hypothetical protein